MNSQHIFLGLMKFSQENIVMDKTMTIKFLIEFLLSQSSMELCEFLELTCVFLRDRYGAQVLHKDNISATPLPIWDSENKTLF